jgi:hypothetical protein
MRETCDVDIAVAKTGLCLSYSKARAYAMIIRFGLLRRIQSPIVRVIGEPYLLPCGQPLAVPTLGEIPKEESGHPGATAEVASEPPEKLREADGVPRTVDDDIRADEMPGRHVKLWVDPLRIVYSDRRA